MLPITDSCLDISKLQLVGKVWTPNAMNAKSGVKEPGSAARVAYASFCETHIEYRSCCGPSSRHALSNGPVVDQAADTY